MCASKFPDLDSNPISEQDLSMQPLRHLPQEIQAHKLEET